MDLSWVTSSVVLAIHDEQLAEHGGVPGVRDIGLLESALARPAQIRSYGEDADLIALAGAYGYGIARNHPFVDGNKRVSAIVTELFLNLNGVELQAADDDVVETWIALAKGQMSEPAFIAWLRDHAKQTGGTSLLRPAPPEAIVP